MRRVIALFLAVMMLLCFSACGKSDDGKTTNGTGAQNAVAENPSMTDPLQFAKGSDEAYCPVCQKTVSWMGLTQDYVDTIVVTDSAGKLIDSAIMSETVFENHHYYLAEDLTYYDSPVMGFFRGPGKGETSCLHLNDHNITTPATTCIFGNSGILNVMGNGIVTGYSPNSTEGAAVRNGNRNANNAVNLYGGTYKRTEQTSLQSPVVAFDGAGRTVSVYDGVVIDGGAGVAVFADSSASREKDGYLLLQGCTVKGDVKLDLLDAFMTKVDIIDAVIDGTVIIPQGHLLSLSGKVEIDKLSVEEGVKVVLGELTEGTSVTVDASGIFSAITENADTYVQYFKAAAPGCAIAVKDGALSCE